MKVSVQANVDIESEVDVCLDDVLREFVAHVEASDVKHVRRVLSAIDWMTRILDSIPDNVVAALPDTAAEIICERLRIQASRYDRAERG